MSPYDTFLLFSVIIAALFGAGLAINILTEYQK